MCNNAKILTNYVVAAMRYPCKTKQQTISWKREYLFVNGELLYNVVSKQCFITSCINTFYYYWFFYETRRKVPVVDDLGIIILPFIYQTDL